MQNEKNNRMAKSLDDIFDDDEFGWLDTPENKSVVKTEEDRLIDSFLEINTFYEKNGRGPSVSSMSEYGLLSKLKNFRSNEKHKIAVKGFDRFNLLGDVEIEDVTIDDIFEDDAFDILNTENDSSIFNFSHTPKHGEREAADYTAQRKPMSDKEFEKYELMFQQVHKELKEGTRKLAEFNNAETNLIEGKFYLVDGILAYLEVSKAEKVIKENKSGDRVRLEGRTITIFENGTKSNMLFRSLGKAILKNGKLVTDPAEKTEEELWKNAGLVSEEDIKSGWIYVLKSKSKNPKISQMQDLYKIGFSNSSVKETVKNASKQGTYLFADVEIIASYKCYNLDTHQFENLIHRFFGECCLNIDLYDENKQRITPREWFVVPLSVIDETIKLMISGGILNYSYDLENQKLFLK